MEAEQHVASLFIFKILKIIFFMFQKILNKKKSYVPIPMLYYILKIAFKILSPIYNKCWALPLY
jgi:hypothetical protein